MAQVSSGTGTMRRARADENETDLGELLDLEHCGQAGVACRSTISLAREFRGRERDAPLPAEPPLLPSCCSTEMVRWSRMRWRLSCAPVGAVSKEGRFGGIVRSSEAV